MILRLFKNILNFYIFSYKINEATTVRQAQIYHAYVYIELLNYIKKVIPFDLLYILKLNI